jgi:hypothetical protein
LSSILIIVCPGILFFTGLGGGERTVIEHFIGRTDNVLPTKTLIM